MSSLLGDIRNRAELCEVVAGTAPELVVHLAAQPLVRRAYIDPVQTFDTNVMGTVNLLDAVRAADKPAAVIVFTSDKCYENREWHWGYREADQLGGFDPYSSSKACAELVTSAYRRSFFQPQASADRAVSVATVRAGNVIGGGDWAEDRIVPDIVRAFASGVPARIRRPDAVRPWQHVLEPIRGCLLLAQHLMAQQGAAFATSWNLGPPDSDARSVLSLARGFQEQWKGGELDVVKTPGGPHEACYLKLDSSQARGRLGWWPQWDLDRALSETVAWYRERANGQDMRARTLHQIRRYTAGEPVAG
jgi:CDP-glucose 4,6-dehydratase